jgi:hypothetical protein
MRDYLKIFLWVFVLTLTGCAASGSLPNLSGDAADAVEPGRSEFVELNDGTIIEGEIKGENLRKRIIVSKGHLTISGHQYSYKEIAAFQNDQNYYRKDNYNDFAHRIIRGKINVYRTYHEGAYSKGGWRSYELYYLQKGDKDKVVAFEIKTLERMVSDFQPAMDKLNEYKTLSKKDKRFKGDSYLNAVIRIYNKGE